MAGETKAKGSLHWWWFDSYNKKDIISPRRSPWLQSTLSELDEKTKAMLSVIEEDADSFAQRAEMYYKRRPELISMMEDFYRAYRSLAERYDQVKCDAGFRLLNPGTSVSPVSSEYPQEKSIMTCTEISYDSYSETYYPLESGESEVDDPKPEEEKAEDEEVTSEFANGEVKKLREEIERLREENKIQKEQIAEKDEKKREVIRQLSLGMDMLREENVKLRKKCIAREYPKKGSSHSDFHKLKGMFLGKLFNGSPK